MQEKLKHAEQGQQRSGVAKFFVQFVTPALLEALVLTFIAGQTLRLTPKCHSSRTKVTRSKSDPASSLARGSSIQDTPSPALQDHLGSTPLCFKAQANFHIIERTNKGLIFEELRPVFVCTTLYALRDLI